MEAVVTGAGTVDVSEVELNVCISQGLIWARPSPESAHRPPPGAVGSDA
jgi:hypothetical protein